MKINPNTPSVSGDYLRIETDSTSSSSSRPSGSVAPTSDSVALSGDVQFANAAVQAAQSAPDVRSDVVARAKAMLDRGEVGQNLDSLASTIVDSLINKS